MKRRALTGMGAVLSVVLLSVAVFATAQSQSNTRCFPETGQCIEGRIRQYWEENGGLPIFGFPIGPQESRTVEGITVQAQWFERTRLELHPENQRPYDVLLGRIGVERLFQAGRNWNTFPRSIAKPGCKFFPETGHNICSQFLAKWSANGLEFDGRKGKSENESLALLGLPLSDPQVERLGDGKDYVVQWFERARFELHPENAAPYDVLLGLLGNEVLTNAQVTPTPTTPPSNSTVVVPTNTRKPDQPPRPTTKPTTPPYPYPVPEAPTARPTIPPTPVVPPYPGPR